ncbi:MAG TPA: 3'(2'),5'-bisphosphate nucleotidase CysQ [Gemmataceae bacterium]|nr:3'(2'),5'-bisphosphate nucleotidase CysQ [Gemmataceae bacterium]
MAYEKELQTALEAAKKAGEVILHHYSTFLAIPDAKADISTQADRDSQETILQHIRESFPQDSLCAEETTATLASANQEGPRWWIVDPIDGTRGFARKNGEFSVMVAFLDEGLIRAGVVFEPSKGRLTYAKQDGGCWRQDQTSSPPIRCRVKQAQTLSDAILTQSHTRKPGRQQTLATALVPGKIIETYSAGIKLAQVARGEADLYLNTYLHFNDWDICAGQILVEEAGGTVTGLHGEPIRYGVGQKAERTGLLASNGLLHQASLDVIAKADPGALTP